MNNNPKYHYKRSMAIFDRKVGDKYVEDCHVAIAPRKDGLFITQQKSRFLFRSGFVLGVELDLI